MIRRGFFVSLHPVCFIMVQTTPSCFPCNAVAQKLMTASRGKRISRVLQNKQTVWIKRMDCDSPILSRWFHATLFSKLVKPYLRAAPLRSPQEQLQQEIRKLSAFKAARIPVPDIICAQETALMLSDVGKTIQKRLAPLKKTAPRQHEAMLVACAKALGEVHAAGLCHGRPHPRDMFLSPNGKIGFFDFEEEPEAVMSLSQAQARDIWLLFLQICMRAQDKDHTPAAAFNAWQRYTAPQTLEDLRHLVRFFRHFLPPLQALKAIRLGKDGQRMLIATEFFISHLGI
ncbi:MAG: Putative serine/threonine kinase [Candidatus Tokpelaia hoelldobleri]|uniref:Serine/threonine kinase n=1 Tax=Candidatus Tokpelaia hoelldobleri TaxID=1902579 RepID=A0A1U9JSE6_9HYPH|nr:MAG: Putative serine/threonine kinase [Candidatus Tokpelaia hoelldoblerii]